MCKPWHGSNSVFRLLIPFQTHGGCHDLGWNNPQATPGFSMTMVVNPHKLQTACCGLWKPPGTLPSSLGKDPSIVSPSQQPNTPSLPPFSSYISLAALGEFSKRYVLWKATQGVTCKWSSFVNPPWDSLVLSLKYNGNSNRKSSTCSRKWRSFPCFLAQLWSEKQRRQWYYSCDDSCDECS